MAQRPPAPQLKYRAPPIFYGRKDEDAGDGLERYESTVLYNRWGPAEIAENFVWRDTPTVAAAPGVVAVPMTDGLRTRFLKAFQPQHYGRNQEARLRQRKQGIDKSGVEYFYDVIDLCRKVDPRMLEEDYLFRGLKPTLVEKIWVTSPRTTAEFLTAVQLHTETSELAIRPEWAVSVLGPIKRLPPPKEEVGTELKDAICQKHRPNSLEKDDDRI
ncbi:Uncharacterized protein APZ42_013860 [Daphnia magna]|uniref:Retrotransposon gag domain-containing protein n=1 Tax=Daphnia magna TaxID=35525 RepID=A0A162QHJ9_9CRUS|nr:Uncharacterized protein APZ42_013860 [Daphnia magna]